MKKEINISQEVTAAVSTIRSAILLSQERAVKAINQEQLALYYGSQGQAPLIRKNEL